MNKTIRKNIFREIIRTPGRFLAILGIIMLGAGFFVGLRVTRDAMVRTAQTYLEDSRFYDFELVSTLGYTQREVDAINEGDSVVSAEGSYKKEALVSAVSGDDIVVSFLRLPEHVNLPTIVSGRAPEKADEVMLDASSSRGYVIGDEIELSELNTEEDLDAFTGRIFTVTGFARSPLYLNYERGNTSLGTGSVAMFAYVTGDAFTADYYTSVYVRCGLPGDIYTDTYDDAADAAEPPLTAIAEEQAGLRYVQLKADTEKELKDAEAEYEDGLEEYKQKRADAEKELSDAVVKLADARAQLDQGYIDYEQGKTDLEDARIEAQEQFAAAEKKLSDAAETLLAGEKAYAEGLAKYQAGQAQYNAGLAQYNSSVEQYTKIFELITLYTDFRTASGDTIEVLTDIMDSMSGPNTDESLTPEEREDEFQRIWNENRDPLLDSMDGLIEASETLADDWEAQTGSSEELDAFRQRIAGLQETVDKVRKDDTDIMQSIRVLLAATRDLYSGASSLLEEYSAEMEGAQGRMDDAMAQLEESRQQLADAKVKLDASRKQLDDGWSEYFAGTEELNSQRKSAEDQMAEAEDQLAEAQQKLVDGEAEYAQGVEDLKTARSEARTAFKEAEDELKDARIKIDDGWQQLADLESPSVYVLGRWANVGYVCLESDAGIVKNVSRIFPFFFFLVAALICVTTMARMVSEQRGQLGVLLSLGYSRATVMSKYMVYAGSAALIGCGVGIPFCSWLFPMLIFQAYRIMYSFAAKLEYYLDWPLYIAVTLAYVLVMLFVTWTALRKELSDMPANIIRPKAPQLGKRVLLERIPAVWGRLSFMWKVTMRNIFRYHSRVFMMLLGVAGCTALMITGYGIRDSIQDIVKYQYGEITRYEYEVTFTEALNDKQQEAFAESANRYSGDALFVNSQSLNFRNGKNEKSAYLITVSDTDDFSEFISLHRGSRQVDFPGTGEAVICSALAEQLDVKTGDTVSFTYDGKQCDLTVCGLFDNYIYYYVYINEETFEELTGSPPEIRTAYVMGREDGIDAVARLLNQDHVMNVTAGSVLKTRIGGIMDNLIYIVLLTIVTSAALAFIVIYNLININITERMREIATVKVLGFYPAEAAIYVLRENILLTALGALLGVPLGILLNKYVMNSIKVDLVSFVARVKFPSFIWSIAFTLLFSVLVYIIMMRKLDKIDMASALKSAE